MQTLTYFYELYSIMLHNKIKFIFSPHLSFSLSLVLFFNLSLLTSCFYPVISLSFSHCNINKYNIAAPKIWNISGTLKLFLFILIALLNFHSSFQSCCSLSSLLFYYLDHFLVALSTFIALSTFMIEKFVAFFLLKPIAIHFYFALAIGKRAITILEEIQKRSHKSIIKQKATRRLRVTSNAMEKLDTTIYGEQ